MCHVCNSNNKTIARMDCSKCIDQYCEACLFNYFNIQWFDVASKRADWRCPRCQNTCRCAACDEKANLRHKPMIPQQKPRALMFSRPEEDMRNRGGVADVVELSFDSTCDEDEDMLSPSEDNPRRGRPRKTTKGNAKGKKRKPDGSRDNDLQSPQRHSVTRMSFKEEQPETKRRKQKTPAASQSPTLRSILPASVLQSRMPMQSTIMSPPATVRTPLSSPSTLSSPSSSISSSSLTSQSGHPQPSHPQPSNQVTADRLRDMMGLQEERAMRFAYENGLWRTIKTFHEEQEMSEQLRQIFEIDAFWAKRSQATRMSFQEDVLEKFGPLFRPQLQ